MNKSDLDGTDLFTATVEDLKTRTFRPEILAKMIFQTYGESKVLALQDALAEEVRANK